MDTTLYLPGRSLRIEYPSHNRLDLPLEYVERSIAIVAVRDFRQEPLDVSDFLSRPMIRRGSILLFADDLGLGYRGRRRFWLEAIRGVAPLPHYRLGVYDPTDPLNSVEWISRPFAPTVRDRRAMVRAIGRFFDAVGKACEAGLRLRAFPVEN
jgi:hypothetical protein